MKKILITFSILFFIQNSFSQTTINDYKYIIVPSSFEFLGEKDKYQLNSLTKFLFNKYGYTAFMEDEELPQDLIDNRCLAMTAHLEDQKGFLRTKVQFHLKDCAGQTIVSSRVGDTKEKIMDKSFQLALRDAFESFKTMEYSYQPNNSSAQSTPPRADQLPAKQETIIADDAAVEVIEEEPKDETAVVVEEKVKAIKPVESKMKAEEEASSLLYAQPIENGFQIIDTQPKKVMVLFYTGMDDVFMVDGENAIVYKKNDKWVYAYIDGSLKTKELNIKF